MMIAPGSRFLPRKGINDVNRAIRHVVSHAGKNVPFYREAFNNARVCASAIRGIDDLPTLPVTDRLELMAGGPAFYLRQGADPLKLTVKHTTGTTGTPVMIHMNFMEQAFRKLTLLDSFRRNAKLTFPFEMVDVGPEQKDQSTKGSQQVGPVKIIRLFRAMPLEDQIEILRRSKPALILGRPSTLWQLALAFQQKAVRPPAPRLVLTGAEMLFPHVRLLLEEVFGCRVADYYNCEEVGNLAWECPEHSDRMHPNTATSWMEAVDRDGNPVPNGQEGRLVVTNLYNHTMPFIRYALGDRGILLDSEACSCGFTGPVMRLTEGRDENFIILPDGKEITPRLMYDVVNTGFPHDEPGWHLIDHIRTFQIVQEARDLIVVKAVPGPLYSERIWREVQKNIKRLHPAFRFEAVLVEDLSPEPGRKFHQIHSSHNSRWRREQNTQSESGENSR